MTDIKPMPTTAEGFAADLRDASTYAAVVGMMWAGQITAAAADLIEAQAARIAELERERKRVGDIAVDAVRGAIAGHKAVASEMEARATAAEAERDRMRAALEPFADAALGIPQDKADPARASHVTNDARCPGTITSLRVSDFRRARAALAQTTGAGDG